MTSTTALKVMLLLLLCGVAEGAWRPFTVSTKQARHLSIETKARWPQGIELVAVRKEKVDIYPLPFGAGRREPFSRRSRHAHGQIVQTSRRGRRGMLRAILMRFEWPLGKFLIKHKHGHVNRDGEARNLTDVLNPHLKFVWRVRGEGLAKDLPRNEPGTILNFDRLSSQFDRDLSQALVVLRETIVLNGSPPLKTSEYRIGSRYKDERDSAPVRRPRIGWGLVALMMFPLVHWLVGAGLLYLNSTNPGDWGLGCVSIVLALVLLQFLLSLTLFGEPLRLLNVLVFGDTQF